MPYLKHIYKQSNNILSSNGIKKYNYPLILFDPTLIITSLLLPSS